MNEKDWMNTDALRAQVTERDARIAELESEVERLRGPRATNLDANEDTRCGNCGRELHRRLLYCSVECQERDERTIKVSCERRKRIAELEAERDARIAELLEDKARLNAELTEAGGECAEWRERSNELLAERDQRVEELEAEVERLRWQMNTKYWDIVKADNIKLKSERDELREEMKLQAELLSQVGEHNDELRKVVEAVREWAEKIPLHVSLAGVQMIPGYASAQQAIRAILSGDPR